MEDKKILLDNIDKIHTNDIKRGVMAHADNARW